MRARKNIGKVFGACVIVVTAFVVLPTTPSAFAANPSADIDQCGNGPASAPEGCTATGNWIHGDLTGTKAHYLEGDSVPFRFKFDNLDTSTSHTITFQWDTTKGGKHAYDYVTTSSATEPSLTRASVCPDAVRP